MFLFYDDDWIDLIGVSLGITFGIVESGCTIPSKAVNECTLNAMLDD